MDLRHWLRIPLLLMLGILTLLGGRLGHADVGDPPVGCAAPRGCWTMEGGCAGRTGRALTDGLDGRLEEAWRIDLDKAFGQISSEPRVWHDRVFVSTLAGSDGRALHVFNLGNGRPVAKPLKLRSPDPLAFGVWEDRVLVQRKAGELALYRLTGGAFEQVWSVATLGRYYAPLLLEDDVLSLDGEDVVCYDALQGEERWRVAGHYRGQLTATGTSVIAIRSDDIGNLHVEVFDRRTGRVLSPRDSFIGTYVRKGMPAEGVIADVSDHGPNVFFQHHQDLRTQSGVPLRTGRLVRTDAQQLVQGGLHDFLLVPVSAGASWIGPHKDEKMGRTLTLAGPDPKEHARSRQWTLAEASGHPTFVAERLPPTVVGETVFIGPRAVHLPSRRVAWLDEGLALRYRPVPAQGALLVVPDEAQLMCLRVAGAQVAGALFLGPAHMVATDKAPPALRQPGVVLLMDDAWHEGDFQLDPAGMSVTLHTQRGKREKEDVHPIEEVALVLDANDRVLYTSSFQGTPRILARWHFHRHAEAYYKFAKAAYKTKDWRLMERLVREASVRGVSDKQLAFPRKQIDSLRARAAKVDEKKRAKLEAEITAAVGEDTARTTRILESPLEDPRWEIQRPFARQILRRDGSHARAQALVRARMPAYIPMPEPFVALEWIDFVDQLRHTTAERVPEPVQGTPGLTRLQREYGSALTTWRKDLIALQSSDLLILTPLVRPGRIAGCLAMGSLVCEALESVFAGGSAVRSDPWPLILRLYEDKKEYLAASADQYSSVRERSQMAFTAGHYDALAGISRIFLPRARSGWSQVMSVYAHELAHHWIAERCPLFKSAEYRPTAGVAGYWIVEGFATFVEEFRWSLEDRSWETSNPSAESLDIVANAKPEQLLPWETVLNLPQLAFGRLERKDTGRRIPMRWRLGYTHILSDANMFYAQASAVCHYLYHAGEKQRQQLLAYVRAYYTGSLPRDVDTIQHAFGMTPAALGRLALAHAQEMNQAR